MAVSAHPEIIAAEENNITINNFFIDFPYFLSVLLFDNNLMLILVN